MPLALSILAHTPPWVWALLAYVAWAGARSLGARTVPLWRLLIVPVLFCAEALAVLARSPAGPAALAVALLAAGAAAPLGFALGPAVAAVDRRTVALRGSAVPLARNLLLFGAQYAVAAGAALHPAQRDAWALAGAALSGVSLGYFAGWAAALGRAALSPSTPGPSRS